MTDAERRRMTRAQLLKSAAVATPGLLLAGATGAAARPAPARTATRTARSRA